MRTNKTYLYSTVLIMFVLPLLSIIFDRWLFQNRAELIFQSGKWFLFWAIGIRLFIAGLRQMTNPGFTASTILGIPGKESYIVIRELGFANFCMGSAAFISLFVPSWRIVAAFTGGMFLGIAGVNHVFRKPSNPNKWIPLVSNLFVFVIMAIYVLFSVFAR